MYFGINPKLSDTNYQNNDILCTTKLSKRFGGVIAVDHLNFTLKKGEIRCIIGPNGAGKSTFTQLVCGIYQSDQGQIILNDVNITKLTSYKRVRLGLGIKFQTNRTFRNLTVKQNLEIALGLKKFKKGQSKNNFFDLAVELFELNKFELVLARELGHHYMQWLEICMALAADPQILFLDEPTAGMSLDETSFTAKVIKKINSEGLTIVIVEHDMAFVREIAQTVSVLHQGKMFAEDSFENISNNDDVKKIYLGTD